MNRYLINAQSIQKIIYNEFDEASQKSIKGVMQCFADFPENDSSRSNLILKD